MDPFSAIAITTSLFSFSASGLLLVQNFIKSTETLRRVQREITVLQHILEECVEIVTSQNHPTPLPPSLDRTLVLCHEDQLVLLQVLEKIYKKKRPVLRMMKITFYDHELMASYHSFRDSVLLLRDLSSDAEIAQLLLDQDGDDSEEEVASMQDRPNTANGEDSGQAPQPASQDGRSTRPRNRKRRLERFTRDLGNLLAADFTRDLIIVMEKNSSEPSERFHYVPLRNKIDTYSDENFISHKVLERYSVGENKIRAIPEGEQKERELGMLGGYRLKPQREVTLEWYRPKDAQKRETTFIVAENNPPFDTLICKKDWDTEIPKSAFVICGRGKKKAERKAEAKEDMKREKIERELVQKQLEEVSNLDAQQKGAA
ncbi:hypothetical protein C8A00DRAFT_34537 [Chaetomidium leptoderma]|uniref:Fungal N-terminal domain-containing protein n=1 Tax=Chaetomidium leptoderma TaxID=669021 RepID=A0AAN6ZWI9_9PEZI|nr:hypothetical protein C8A00DRAFT_34537 [Chaetomidium leptoderma]